MSRPSLFLSIIVLLSQFARSDIISLSLILDADSQEVHYVEGWLEAPAHVDLSKVKFLTTVVPSFNDDFFEEDDQVGSTDDAILNDDQGGTTPPGPDSNGGGEEVPQSPPDGGSETPAPSPTDQVGAETPAPTGVRRSRQLDQGGELVGGGAQRVKQVLDIVLFYLPSDCKQNSWGGCDWSALGVGVKDGTVQGGVSYCCSADAVTKGSCTSDMAGQLMINHDVFQGDHRTVEVPTAPDTEFALDYALFEVAVTGDYVILLANCDDYGLDVFSLGSMEWKSSKGYLPGEMFGLMFFDFALTIVYLVMFLWYGLGMRMYQDAAIGIQKFILATIFLGLLEFFCRAMDLATWNLDGIRSTALVWAAVILGVLKRGITRCLFVMVSMGWGVVRDSLGLALMKIVFLGLVYCGLTMVRDFFLVLAVDKVQSWSASTEETLVNLTVLISLALVAVDLIFFVWIMSSLVSTTEYLRNLNQTSKLQRHLRLRCIILTAFAASVVWVIFSIVTEVIGLLSTAQYWILEGAVHLINLYVIASVAILWRPNPNAKDYAMQMELPMMGDDDGENDLELSCVVPSAGDMDDGDDPDHLPVDDAVAT